MNIAVIGCGYVGLVTANGLASFGHNVVAIDKDVQKIDLINSGQIPIYEDGLAELNKHNMMANRLRFTGKIQDGIADAQVIFIAVGTPPEKNGTADLTQVKAVACEIAEFLKSYTVIVNKSTVPVGTARMVYHLIKQNRKKEIPFDVASNPEFLREGSAISDFLHPDRVIIGCDSNKVEKLLKELYYPLLQKNIPFIYTNPETAELIKYASNAFLATKISFINEIAHLCEAVGADVLTVAHGMGLDKRIGSAFLNPGPGYGGSCFPKDTKALIQFAHTKHERMKIVESVDKANEDQKQRMVEKIKRAIGDLRGKTVTILGIAFKADTDDIRESPALTIIPQLIGSGCTVRAHDPKALDEAKNYFKDAVEFFENIYQAAIGTDALIILTDWEFYTRLNLQLLKKTMRQPILIDLRNIYNPSEISAAGFKYVGIGRIYSATT